MLRFSLYFLLSLAIHAMASLFLRESVVEAGRAQEMAQQPAVMMIQLPPAPAAVAASQPVAVEPEKPQVEPEVMPLPPVVKPVIVEKKVEPRPLAKTAPPKVQPQNVTPPKPVKNKTAPGPEVARLDLPTAATSVGKTAPPMPQPMKEVFSSAPSFLQPPTAPRYPSLAKRRNQQGVVLLEVRLDERGQQRALQIVRSSGVESLDEAALEAVAAWHFRPETEDGRAVPSRVQIPIEFALTASR